MIVRELITLMGFKVDKSSEKKAQGSVDGLKRGMQALSAIFVTGVIAEGFRRVVNLGSDAAETMNVITTSFEGNTDAVLEWASVQAKELGRSEFALRDYAATLGAVLRPMTESSDLAAMMSTDLAQLTVDLGSFFNAAEPDVLLALRSGISGEAEPLKRFGIVMNQAALEAFALEQELGVTLKEMTEAQKVGLRYEFIMAKTAKAQGDAARTAGGFANLTKQLQAVITDLATEIGMELLPASEGTLMVLIDLVRTIRGPLLSAFRTVTVAITVTVRTLDDLIEGLTGVEHGTMVVAAVGVAAWAAYAAPIVIVIAILALLGLAIAAVIEDLEAMGDGGESVIGGLIGEFEHLRDETGSIFQAITGIITTAIDFWADKLFGFATDTQGKMDMIFDGVKRDIETVTNLLARIGTFQAGLPGTVTGAVGGQIVNITNNIETSVSAAAGTAGEIASETVGRVQSGTDRLLRRTAAQIGVGGG
jgi:hypothetical protein